MVVQAGAFTFDPRPKSNFIADPSQDPVQCLAWLQRACQPKEAAEARKTRRDETNALFSPLFLTLSLLTSLLGSRTEKCDLARVGLAAELRGRAETSSSRSATLCQPRCASSTRTQH